MNSDNVISGLDRRVQRTRQLLQEALLALVQEKAYDKITVQEILDRANVGRSTFYAHFHDKDDLLAGNFAQRAAEELFANQAGQPSGEQTNEKHEPVSEVVSLLPLLQHVQENFHLYEALQGSDGMRSILAELRTSLQSVITERIRDLRPEMNEPQSQLAIRFLCEGLIAAMLYWLEHQPTTPPKEVDAQLQHLMLNGLLDKR